MKKERKFRNTNIGNKRSYVSQNKMNAFIYQEEEIHLGLIDHKITLRFPKLISACCVFLC